MAARIYLKNAGKGLAGFLLMAGGLLELGAQDRIVEEIASRAADREEAYLLLQKGDRAYLAGNFEEAVISYGGAVELLPVAAEGVRELRVAALERFSQASVQRARDLGRTGDYEEANRVLNEAEASMDGRGDAALKVMRGKLLSPIRTEAALTPEHSAKVDEVRRLLYTAESYYNLGDFDKSHETYDKVLRIDPYNTAARRGKERASSRISNYARAAYDETRATLLAEVAGAWEQDPNLTLLAPELEGQRLDFLTAGEREAAARLSRMMVDNVAMDGATLEEAVDYLRQLSRELDQNLPAGQKRGIDFIVNLGSPELPKVQAILDKRITLKLRSVPFRVVLDAITRATGTEYEADEHAVVIRPTGSVSDALIDRVFRVPLDFLTREAISQQSAERDPFAVGRTELGEGLTVSRMTAREKLESLGVRFPDGAGAGYNPATGQLRVRNTDEQIRYVAQIAATMAETEPLAVVIKATMVDIEQSSLEELGYDWILNDVYAANEFAVSGGSVGTGSDLNDTIPGSPVTAGNRSGTGMVVPNGIDALLNRGDIGSGGSTAAVSFPGDSPGAGSGPLSFTDQSRAPGILQLQQVLDGNLAQLVLRGLSQAKGSDIMNRQEVITRSGQSATIESVREFIYASEYEPPEIPQQVSGTLPVTPAHPSSFGMRKIGNQMTVVPQVSADRKLINLNLNPVRTDFEGFVNYGSPINGASSETFFNRDTGVSTVTNFSQLSRNAILMPIFKTIQGTTNVTIADGSTVVIGGLMDSRVQKVEDGVPLLKDLPLLGRFFRSEGDQVIRRAIMIFVEVELLDPSGQPYRFR